MTDCSKERLSNIASQSEFDRLGVLRRTVSEILHEHRPVTPDTAIRLGKLLGNGAGLWLRMQQNIGHF